MGAVRLSVGAALLVLAASLAPAALASSPDPDPTANPSYLVLLKDQRSHEASLAVRAAYGPALDALAIQRTARIQTLADLGDPAVLALSGEIDRLLGEFRLGVASEASRLHFESRGIVESAVVDLGGLVTYRSPLLNLLVIRLPEDRVAALRTHPLVAAVEPDLAVDFALNISVPASGAMSFWGGGFTGGPFELVVPDTGVDKNHTDLLGKISDERVFHDAARLQGDYIDDFNTADDLHGHGTHISGIVASQDSTYRGVAHGMLGVVNAKFGYLCSCPAGGRGIVSDSMKAMDWAILTAGGDVLSLSFGGGSNDNGENPWGLYMDALVDDLGIPVSLSAGNSGPGSGSLGQPATSYNVMTVGAIDDQNSIPRGDDVIAGYSSRGPTGDGRLKPDVAASGSDIISTAHDWEGGNPDFVAFWGTSMAAPHVGAGFLLQEHAGGGPGFPARSKAVLLNAAQDKGSAGPDNTYGWGSMDLAEAWTYRNTVVEGDAQAGTPLFYRIPGNAGDRVTMVWQKHIVYNGINAPTTWWALTNVDLNLYDEALNNLVWPSGRTRDNVEQVSFVSATTGIAKVFVVGAVNPGPQEPFALAARVTPTLVAPPSLSIALSAPSPVNSGQNFVVTGNVTNSGGLRTFGSSVTLNLPPALTLVAGANPSSLGTIPAGTTRTATWTVTTSTVGTHSITASSLGTAYGEIYAATGGPIQVTVLDTTPPTIANHGAVPSPQNVGGIVNISASISDNVGVTGAWVEVYDPGSVLLGNFSMPVDPISGRRYYVRPYTTLGRHDYAISATDPTGNWAFAAGAFQISDLEAPQLAAVAATPNPQEVHFSVNVTATATDNVGVWVAYLQITDPVGGSTNVTMSFAGSTVYLDRAYDLVGLHTFRVSARDAAWNWAAATGSFTIRDTTAPLADGGPDRTVEAGTAVPFDGSASSDNVAIVSYTWQLSDGGPVTYTGITATHTFVNIGTYVVTLTVRDAAGNPGTDAFTVFVVDPRPPDIADVRSDPPLQDVGAIVAVSAIVFDQFGLAGVWLRVQDPTGATLNATMVDLSGRHTLALTYRVKGLHLFEIWASDPNDNWGSARGAFEIADRSPPVVTANGSPSPQDVFAPVDVTATVVENDAVATVSLEVRDPFGALTTIPMALVGTEWRATFTPTVLGIHGLRVWATDVSGNVGLGSATVSSVDRAPPTIAATVPTGVEVLESVDATIAVADNLGPFVGTLEFRAPSGASMGNRTLFGASPFTLAQRFTVLGPHAWTVYAVDPSGNAAASSGTIQVIDSQPPVADAGPDRTVIQGTSVPLDGSGSTDNYGIEAYAWTFAANGAPQVLRLVREVFAFRQAGTYTIRLLVTDVAGNTAEDIAVIEVVPADTDADGVRDDEEITKGWDPYDADSDNDGLLDGADADPLAADLSPVRLFASWGGLAILFIAFLIILLAVFRQRRRRRPERSPPESPAVAPSTPSGPPGENLPPPPSD